MTVATSPSPMAHTGRSTAAAASVAQIDAAITLLSAIHAKLVTNEQQRQRLRAGEPERRARRDDRRHAQPRTDRGERGDQRGAGQRPRSR